MSPVSKPFLDNKYVAQTVYEVKCPGTTWLMHFVVAKHLNALVEVSKALLELCNIIEYMYSIQRNIYHLMLIKMFTYPSHLKMMMVTLN